jgi:hypothetical protein
MRGRANALRTGTQSRRTRRREPRVRHGCDVGSLISSGACAVSSRGAYTRAAWTRPGARLNCLCLWGKGRRCAAGYPQQLLLLSPGVPAAVAPAEVALDWGAPEGSMGCGWPAFCFTNHTSVIREGVEAVVRGAPFVWEISPPPAPPAPGAPCPRPAPARVLALARRPARSFGSRASCSLGRRSMPWSWRRTRLGRLVEQLDRAQHAASPRGPRGG